eukprot:9491590-Alexandrium_andersonii.AAC.1
MEHWCKLPPRGVEALGGEGELPLHPRGGGVRGRAVGDRAWQGQCHLDPGWPGVYHDPLPFARRT